MTSGLLRSLFPFGVGAALVAVAPPGPAAEGIAVDLELALAIDTSGSVDPWEYQLQIQGLVAAFRDPEVQAAIAGSTPNGIAVALIQWSGPGEQVAITDWVLVVDAAGAERFALEIAASGRQYMGRTAIAGALGFATTALLDNRYEGARLVIDLSGDGRPNDGRDPGRARDAAIAQGITVNGLAVMTDIADLDQYFRERVIGGPGAFLVTARDYDDFVRAIRDKLIREIRGTPVGGIGPSDGHDPSATFVADSQPAAARLPGMDGSRRR